MKHLKQFKLWEKLNEKSELSDQEGNAFEDWVKKEFVDYWEERDLGIGSALVIHFNFNPEHWNYFPQLIIKSVKYAEMIDRWGSPYYKILEEPVVEYVFNSEDNGREYYHIHDIDKAKKDSLQLRDDIKKLISELDTKNINSSIIMRKWLQICKKSMFGIEWKKGKFGIVDIPSDD